MTKIILGMMWTMFLATSLSAQSVTTDVGKPRRVLTDAMLGGSNYTLSKDTVYVLTGYTYFEAPGTLTIQPGTIIKSVDTAKTALVITRGSYINAQGTPTEPIIFTSIRDSVSLADNGPDPGVNYLVDMGLWGGIIICGYASLNIADSAIVEGLPPADPRGYYGGHRKNDNDSSGVMRYVQIKYSGITVEANKELQSLTVCCAGSRTVLEYIESFASADDGFEFFGGTFNTKYLASVFAEDDAFDYDHGFRGKHQFWFALQAPDRGDNIGEYDSGDAGALTNHPLANPLIYNATYLGRGATATGGGAVTRFKEFGGGRHFNSIFADFSTSNAFQVDSGAGATSWNRLFDSTNQLVMQNNLWFKSPAQTSFTQFVSRVTLANYLAANQNTIQNPLLRGISRTANQQLDPRPQPNSPALTLPRKDLPQGDPWWTPANYYGAFDPNAVSWLWGWTSVYQNGILNPVQVGIEDISGNMPNNFNLKQNYPNPFNPTTSISFVVRQNGKVNLSVYNSLGQKVATLADGYFKAGEYKVQWNAASMPSGVYLYRLTTDNYSETKKMVLMK